MFFAYVYFCLSRICMIKNISNNSHALTFTLILSLSYTRVHTHTHQGTLQTHTHTWAILPEAMKSQIGLQCPLNISSWGIESDFAMAYCSMSSFTSYIQFHQHFTSSFCANILTPKNYRAKLLLEKSFEKHFCMKKPWLKCRWNWHLHLIRSHQKSHFHISYNLFVSLQPSGLCRDMMKRKDAFLGLINIR